MRNFIFKLRLNIVHLSTLILTSLVASESMADDKKSLDQASAGGIAVSMLGKINNGKSVVTGYVFDLAFKHSTKGKVGRNGKVGNVSSITLTGLNVPPFGGVGSVTASEDIKNEADAASVDPSEDQQTLSQKIAGVGTAMHGERVGVNAYKAKFSTMGLWLNTQASGNSLSMSSGMFADGVPTHTDWQPNSTKLNEYIYHGLLTSTHNAECDVPHCAWQVEAAFTGTMHIDKSITIVTSKSIRVEENEDSGKKLVYAKPELNITGTLNFDKQTNTFKGSTKNDAGDTGTAIGRFYGLNAEEISIVFGIGNPEQDSGQMGNMYGGR